MDRRIELAVSLAFTLFGLFMIGQATTIAQGMMRDPVGPRAAFYVCGGIMAAGGLLLAARTLRAWRGGAGNLAPEEGTADEEGYPASARRAFLLMGACLLYALAFIPAGYLISTPLFIVASLTILGERRWALSVTVAVLFTGIVYLIFAEALGVRLGVGPLTGTFRSLGWINL